MSDRMKWPRRVPLVLLGTMLATAYFAYHVVYGTHGLLAKARHIDRLENVQREVAVLEAVRSRLQQDVAALASEPPHPDSVEEAARGLLGLVRPGDLIVRRYR
jgi:cell division protein FtsB